jgi:hypothetical protein
MAGTGATVLEGEGGARAVAPIAVPGLHVAEQSLGEFRAVAAVPADVELVPKLLAFVLARCFAMVR